MTFESNDSEMKVSNFGNLSLQFNAKLFLERIVRLPDANFIKHRNEKLNSCTFPTNLTYPVEIKQAKAPNYESNSKKLE